MDENSPEADEFGQSIIACDEVWRKCSGILPVCESEISLLSGTSVDADGKESKADDCDDLDSREPELELAVEADGQQIGQGDEDPENGDEDGDRDVGNPVLNDQTRGSQFKSVRQRPGEPVNPTHGETETRIEEASRIRGERTGNWHESRHFTQGGHDGVDDAADKDVGDQGAHRTGGCYCRA